MRALLRLVVAELLRRPLRMLTTSAATAAAAALVVWVVSGYDALLASFDEYAELSLGRYTLSVAPIGHFSQSAPGAIPAAAEAFVPDDALPLLRADPAIAAVDPMWTPRLDVAQVVAPGTEPLPSIGLPDVRVVGTDASAPPFDLLRGRWLSEGATDEAEGVLGIEGAEGYHVDVGGDLLVGDGDRARRVRIVGIVDSPRISGWSATVAKQQLLTPGVGGLFVRTALAEQLAGRAARISFIGVVVRPDVDLTAFRFAWAPRLGDLATPCQFQEAHDIEEALDESASAENVAEQAQMATIVALTAALFIIFTTLNMGVAERTRHLALLRAIALTRAQVGFLVAAQGAAFAIIGYVVGALAGWASLAVALRSAPELLEEGARIGPQSLGLAAVAAFGGAALASAAAARRAMRVRPLDAIAPAHAEHAPLAVVPTALAALALLSVYPILAHLVPHGDDAPFGTFMVIGLAALVVGVVVAAPIVVLAVDRGVGPMLARIFGVPPALLTRQLSGNLGRTVGTALALTVGLGLFIAIHVWGHSMLGGFMPTGWPPDAVVVFGPRGIDESQAREVASFAGVVRSEPIVVEQPRLADDLTHSATRASVVRQDNVVLIGIDPEAAFAGPDPLLAFEWREGDRESAFVPSIRGTHASWTSGWPDRAARSCRRRRGSRGPRAWTTRRRSAGSWVRRRTWRPSRWPVQPSMRARTSSRSASRSTKHCTVGGRSSATASSSSRRRCRRRSCASTTPRAPRYPRRSMRCCCAGSRAIPTRAIRRCTSCSPRSRTRRVVSTARRRPSSRARPSHSTSRCARTTGGVTRS